MKLFQFLKSTSGKVNLPRLALVGMVGAGAVLTTYETDKTMGEQERAIRTLSGISSTSYNEGLQNKEGLLTSINIKDSLNQVATPEERAAIEARSGSANNFGLDNVDNIQNVSFGQAAATSETEGLGMGANQAVEMGAGVRSAPIGAPGVSGTDVYGAVADGGSPGTRAGSTTPTPVLASASMAQSSGSSFSGTSGPIGSASGSGGSGGSGKDGGASSEGYQLSGSMPSGSNAVSAMQGAHASSRANFMSGGRDASVSGGRRSFRDSNDLRDISKRSADAARNENRAANEGSRAFLASTKNSGGMAVEGGMEEVGTTGSEDFAPAEANQLRAVGDWGDTTTDDDNNAEKARKRLMWMMLGVLVAALVSAPLAYSLISAGSKAGLFGVPKLVWGWLLVATVIGLAATLIGFAAKYQKEYKSNLMPIMSYVLGAGVMALMASVGAAAMASSGGSPIMAKMQRMMNKVLRHLGVTAGTTAVKEGFQKLNEKDLEKMEEAKKEDANKDGKEDK